MMVFYEKRFPDDQELLAQFLEIILFVYKWVVKHMTSRNLVLYCKFSWLPETPIAPLYTNITTLSLTWFDY